MTHEQQIETARTAAFWLFDKRVIEWIHTGDKTSVLRLNADRLSADLNRKIKPLIQEQSSIAGLSLLGEAILNHGKTGRKLPLDAAIREIEGELSYWLMIMGGDNLSPPLHDGSV